MVYRHHRSLAYFTAFLLSLFLVWIDAGWREAQRPEGGMGTLAAILITLTCITLIRRTSVWVFSSGTRVRVRHKGFLGGIDSEFDPKRIELQILDGGVDFNHVLWLDLPGRHLGVTLRRGGRRSVTALGRRLATELGCALKVVERER